MFCFSGNGGGCDCFGDVSLCELCVVGVGNGVSRGGQTSAISPAF